jgi:hypothetical protein
MTDANYTHFTILADRTGSMGDNSDGPASPSKAEVTTKGIKALIADQAALAGRTSFTLVDFDNWGTTRVVEFASADDRDIKNWEIMPRGGTPLLDAIGSEIVITGEALSKLPEDARPGRVYFVIGTDGEENSSKEYTKARVSALVKQQTEDYGWEFVFIGADIDAFDEAGSLGFSVNSTLGTSGGSMGVAYASTSSAISRSRLTKDSVSYSAQERAAAGGS